ncbi:AAA family ATPase [Geobacter sulfurreducens]|jgi:aminoglycoside phosphotransferase family enzyme/predicted kinase|uniref:Kinase, putative n=1 Tax=Geobacter sulfurreducens (strain ATCC 51573 / DSM 12127 / PCA) TaxID=243231 RepID=Q74D88_GEOSL|nr:bifunctional aminoglycoside phosphotransferase/ATP-binding protein [Geobacter sulfurreducens]AAR34805.1 kinase, putative [Geobacter sulfurreducens PCA]ADI84270.1 kinase, putative [Geobacter sulfurreducens KN400]AJY71688.1 kinase [Geobacter sulfurreducens]QVW36612.1 AAA family ATPase [Geobacter sulfurreducens]UAC05447.1 AAA family ATPase [Geobacter sulfurreducens]
MEQHHVRSLLKPSAYPDPTGSVELVQTHVSYIFLTDNFAYKVKKPVDFGFLNFSTPDRRRFYCEEEVRLNRRLCPDIYLGVAEVRDTPAGAAFVGEGQVIDHAVKMKRLPADRMLDRLLSAGLAGEPEIRAVARVVGTFHLEAEHSSEIDAFGDLATINANWVENFQQTRPYCGITLSAGDHDFIRGWVERFMAERVDLFAARVGDGRIRDGNGDIHMENICLGADGRVCIFDCIEFNNRFRYGDTAADIAFLLMDFDFVLRPDLGAAFLDEYTRITNDASVVEMIDFYKVYRAFVRGKVESMRLSDPQIPENEKQAAAARASRYFRLARGYAVRQGLPPTLFITCGLTGTGKSRLSRELSLDLGLEIASSDVVRKELAGLRSTERPDQDYGAGIYTDRFSLLTYGELERRARVALEGGRSIVVDATFRRRADRERFGALARDAGATFVILHAVCPEPTIRSRLNSRQKDRSEPSDGTWEVYLRQKDEFDPPSDQEGNLLCIDTSDTASAMVDKVLHGLELLPCGKS